MWNWLGFRKPEAAAVASAARFNAKRVRRVLLDCASEIGGEASARTRVAELAAMYRPADDDGKRAFLELLATCGDADDVDAALLDDYAKRDGAARRLAALRLRAALAATPLRVLRQFNLLPDGVKFLVDLRADALRLGAGDGPALAIVDEALLALFRDWFALGNLELRRISWNSPAALLERLMAYEAVHEIRSWRDLRHRLESDRRCYAFFHPRMPDEPLVFVEVALMQQVASSIAPLLDVSTPAIDPRAAEAAVFYSISSTQSGLRGVSFGGFLIKRVVENLLGEFPKLTTFATLSPVPGFRRWLDERMQSGNNHVLTERTQAAFAKVAPASDAEATLRSAAAGTLPEDGAARAALEAILAPLCARYLAAEKKDGLPLDPVARFHFGNGARLDRVNWLSNTSPRGLEESLGIMVNYVYEPQAIEENHEAYFREGRVAMSSAVRRLLRRAEIGEAEVVGPGS